MSAAIDPLGVGEEHDRALSDFSLSDLMAEVARRQHGRDGVGLLQAMELATEEAKQNFGQATLESMLETLPPEDEKPKRCPRCGALVRVRAKNRTRSLRTLNGEVTFRRHYHYCSSCRHGFYPRDEELGVSADGSVSPELEKRLADFAINDSFAECEARWCVHYDVPVSAHLFRRVTDRLGRLCEKSHAAALDETTMPSPKQPPELLIVQNDGSHVPIRGREAWKEAKLAVLVQGERYARRRGGRGLIAQARYAGVLGPQDEFRTRLDFALRMERAGRAGRVAWVADGAKGNWTLADQLAPQAIQVLDWHHAIEHAAECGKTLLGEGSEVAALWQQRCEQLLGAGDVRTLLRELKVCRRQATSRELSALRALSRYYANNRRRMNYARYRELGVPIGSGIVESGHHHGIQRRMKQSGQRWSLAGAKRMVRLRCAYLTAGAMRYHRAIHNAAKLTRRGQIPRVGWVKTRANNHG